MSDEAINDAIHFLKEALTGPEEWRMSELENAQISIQDAIKGGQRESASTRRSH